MPSLRVFREQHYRLILDPEISSPELQIQAHALERILCQSQRGGHHIPSGSVLAERETGILR